MARRKRERRERRDPTLAWAHAFARLSPDEQSEAVRDVLLYGSSCIRRNKDGTVTRISPPKPETPGTGSGT